MVGMGAQGIYENSKEMDGVNGESPKPCALANGDAIFHMEDSEGNTNGSALCPVTPILNRQSGDSVFITSSPLSLESPSFQSKRNDSSPRTPDEGVFDPFAPGPDEMLLAPICKKLVKESQKIVARRLNFDDIEDFQAYGGDNNDVDSLSDKMLLESFYGTLLEAIILKQAEEFRTENQPLEMMGVQSPTSPRPLTGVADTCPGAPMKREATKSRVIDPGLCRKLEF